LAVAFPLRLTPGPGQGLVHILDADGRIAHSAEVESTIQTGLMAARNLAPATDAGFWTAPMNENWIRRYDSAGTRQRHLNIARSWLKPWSETSSSDPYTTRPLPRVVGIAELSENALLVIGYVADPAWQPRNREEVVSASENLNALYDTVIEVVDASTGDILVTRRHADALRLVQSSRDLIFAARETDEGDIKAAIFRVVLIGCS
jgi:hypothetical protein